MWSWEGPAPFIQTEFVHEMTQGFDNIKGNILRILLERINTLSAFTYVNKTFAYCIKSKSIINISIFSYFSLCIILKIPGMSAIFCNSFQGLPCCINWRGFTLQKHNSGDQRWKYFDFSIRYIHLGHSWDTALVCQLCSCLRSESITGYEVSLWANCWVSLFSSQNTQHNYITKKTMTLPSHPGGTYCICL